MSIPWLETEQKALNAALEADRFGHAPLLYGPGGIGKRAFSHWLVARILCQAEQGQRPCGTCRSCLLLQAGTHPDLFLAGVAEEKTQITVDQVRKLCAGLQLTPSIGDQRVGLIEPAERMNANAANALLKTLEEPSSRAWLILVSDRAELLPATVRSRCQKLALHPPRRPEALRWLQSESGTASPDDLNMALDFSGDAPLRAREIIERDGLSRGRAIREVLLDVAGGAPLSASVAEQWAAHPQESWDWISHWIRQWMIGEFGVASGSGHEELPVAGRRDHLAAELARSWKRAQESRKLADTAIRADLLLGKWLLEWQGIFARDR